MAVEKTALDFSQFAMAETRASLDKSVDLFEEVVDTVSKVALRRRIKRNSKFINLNFNENGKPVPRT